MKKIILNILMLALLLTAFSTAVVNANSAIFAGNRITYLDDDPNEPQPEAVFISSFINCSDEDPNEPQPEIAFISSWINCSDEEPNEPQPESI